MASVALSPCDTPPVDYSATIRAEIEREVEHLIKVGIPKEIDRWEADGWGIGASEEDPKPEQVILGYTIAMHRGKELYRDGDTICGVPVVIDRGSMREITVVTNEVEVEKEVDCVGCGDKDCPGWGTEYEERAVEVSVRW